MEKRDIGKSGDGFIDRSRVRILLCDNDDKSSEAILRLLCGCLYQVTSVKSPRQVIDALNAEGPNIDIILSEVDLPMSKGLKMLKYIMRDKELRRIPMIMMSAQDEVPIVVKCLKLGAADYLVKPLRTNELLNLWTHMWRRRRLLGLVEKNIISYDFDMVVSDQSDGNTNSTTLFSEDTDDRSRKSTNPEGASAHQEDDINALAASPVATPLKARWECQPDVPGISDRRTGQMPSVPKKSELKIGESSAFFTYVKSSTSKRNNQVSSVHGNRHQNPKTGENPIPGYTCITKQRPENGQTLENYCADGHPSPNGIAESFSVEKYSTSPMLLDISKQGNSKDFSLVHSRFRNDSTNDVNGFNHPAAYPYYPGVMNRAAMPSASMYHHNLPSVHNPALLPHYTHISQCPPPMPGMAAYSYYPFGICLQPGQIPAPHPWPSFENQSTKEGPLKKVDRREAALMKFRQKRKERCFDKKIRYVNRKKLAERRPRLRGQFVRKVNGVSVDLNGQPASAEDEEDDEEESDDEDQINFLRQDDASSCQLPTINFHL